LPQVRGNLREAVWFRRVPVYFTWTGHLWTLTYSYGYAYVCVCPQGCAVPYNVMRKYVLRTCTVPRAVWTDLYCYVLWLVMSCVSYTLVSLPWALLDFFVMDAFETNLVVTPSLTILCLQTACSNFAKFTTLCSCRQR